MIESLKIEFQNLVSKFTSDQSIINSFWDEIEKQYTQKIRYYHGLTHIHNMLLQARKIKPLIINYDAFLFAIWYHDIVYKPTKKDNEEKSAVFAINRLKALKIDKKLLDIIEKLIISTKKHHIILTENNDNSYLLDIDLSILGTPWDRYKTYIKNIRKEYAIYPSFIYKKGRKQVLQHFLERKTLYFTEKYQTELEIKARENLTKELETL